MLRTGLGAAPVVLKKEKKEERRSRKGEEENKKVGYTGEGISRRSNIVNQDEWGLN